MRKIIEITEEELALSKAEFLRSVGQQTVLIQRDGKTVAVLTSPEQYETTREAKAERAIKAMWALREEMQSIATPEELIELEKVLDSISSGSGDSKQFVVNSGRKLDTLLKPQEQPPLRSPNSFPSMQPASRESVQPYPVRLLPSTISQLEKLKADLGVVPAHFIRDAVESALKQLNRSAQ